MPFKREYFENDPVMLELYLNIYEKYYRNVINTLQIRNRNESNIIRINNNNNIINRNIPTSNNYRNTNYNLNHMNINIYHTNRNILRNNNNNNNQNYMIDGKEVLFGLFILRFKSNKGTCIYILILNILFCGLGTIFIGLNKKSVFYTLFGAIQCFCFFFFLIYDFSFDKKTLFGRPFTKFFRIYFRVIYCLFYLSSIYIGIFRNFLFFNKRKINYNENKEKGLIVFFLNIVIEGSGTILVGIKRIVEEVNCWHKIKYMLYGIIQLIGYLLILFTFSIINKKAIIDICFLFFIGLLSFCFSMYISYKYYKKITS